MLKLSANIYEGPTIFKAQDPLNEIQTQVHFTLSDHMPIDLKIRPGILRETNCTERIKYN